jgi:hypothetical protein
LVPPVAYLTGRQGTIHDVGHEMQVLVSDFQQLFSGRPMPGRFLERVKAHLKYGKARRQRGRE